MKKALRDAAVFLLCFLILFHIVDALTFDYSGVYSTWAYIQTKDQEPIDILFMGNSHTFCDVNPSMINQSTGLNTMVLGIASQPMDQTYENLKTLLHYVHPKVIALESNAMFTTTEALIEEGKEGRLYTNFDSIRNYYYKLCAIVDTMRGHYDKWPEAYSPLFRPTETWKRFKKSEAGESSRINYILGHYPRHNIITNKELTPEIIEPKLIEAREAAEPLEHPESVDALNQFLDLAASESIPVYIFKSPVLNYKNEAPKIAAVVSKMAESDSRISGYMNFSEHMTEIGMEQDDFSDAGHLNREGANKFTVALLEWISEELDIPYDLSKVTGVKGESFEELSDGNYRYTVSVFDNTLVKFYTKNKKGWTTFEADYSDDCSVEIPRISEENKLYYKICSKEEIPGRSYPFEIVEYPFMHDSGETPGS